MENIETSKSWEKARNICIVKTLAKLGHFPSRISEKEAWFLSPLRSETQASFSVSLHKNLWYDFGIGKGGSIIDLIMTMESCTVKEALEYLMNDMATFSFSPLKTEGRLRRTEIRILDVEAIYLQGLIDYLKSRNIPLEVGNNYCKQIWYHCKGKRFFAIGVQNHLGGWELRNKYFKNSSSPKTFSLFENDSKQLLITEGMFDFLSLATLDENLVQNSDSIILNSLAFIKRIETLIPKYKRILLFLDNDPTGKKATASLLNQFDNMTDCSDFYSGFIDLNEKLINEGSWKKGENVKRKLSG
ncbi:toprim domain-containing protein [Salegentibacter sp. LM13S]|uniref:toprim domain-containing protein n=1 Tax=Salegentibacter lacus TaxID=2873599 RepID=UPI001CCDD06A|nr:toprim domain-containing protein [Salegentibacter lacus]MBZ9632580.1 toprim domain-containing protein [Salegentibacter lacus]